MKYLITLVHGTFAKAAPWTATGSAFCKQLGEELDAEIDFQAFEWSGKNSHLARLSASKDLYSLLCVQVKNFPTHKKIIIAHSHGGNIAMYSLNQMGEERDQYELITMATPFLNAKARDFESTLKNRSSIIPGFVYITWTFFSMWFCLKYLGLVFTFDTPKANIVFGIYILSLVLGIFFLLRPLAKYYKERAVRDSKLIVEKVEMLTLSDGQHKFPILAVIEYSDEVKLWFTNLYRLWELLIGGHGILSKFYMLFSIVYLCNWIVFVLYFLLIGKPPFFNASMFIALYGLAAFLIIPTTILIFPLIVSIFKSNPLILGWESVLDQLYIRVVPSITPLGHTRTHVIQYDFKRRNLFGLKHSIYSNSVVIKDICDWINRAQKV